MTLGARYSQDRKYGTNSLFYQYPLDLGPTLFCPPDGVCVNYNDLPFDKTWAQWTGTFGAHYQISDDVMAYVSASRGYLSGGNIIGLANIYGPESMWSYEAGVKSRFWDGKAQLNIAGYHEEIKSLQVFIQSATQSGINNVNGLTQVNGLETELTLAPTEHLSLNATVTLTSAHYGEYLTTDNRFGAPPPGCTFGSTNTLCNFKGNELNQTPPYTVNIGAQYTFNTGFGTITPRVDAYFSGRVQFLPDNYVTSTAEGLHQDRPAPDLGEPQRQVQGGGLRLQHRGRGRDLERRPAVDHARPAGDRARQFRLQPAAHLRHPAELQFRRLNPVAVRQRRSCSRRRR